MVDTLDSGSSERKLVEVRLLSAAPGLGFYVILNLFQDLLN
jgi:hypothetical protein